MRNYLIAFFLFCLASPVSGQTVTGKVTSKTTGEVLAGVTVFSENNTGVSTDSLGRYTLQLPAGNHVITFRMLSFESEKKTVTLQDGTVVEINVQLNEQAQMLNIVVVSAAKFEQKLEEVTVSMEVLKPELIEKRNTFTMEDGVDYIPGVSTIDGQANIRGGSGWSYGAGSRVQILVDDLPQLTADANDTKWTFLPIENLEQVEVIKGASSVLFGSSALNGIINFRTAYPRDTPLTKINLYNALYDKAYITTDKKYSLNFRDHLSSYHGLNFLHSRKISKVDLSVSGNYFKDEGYRQGENEERGRFGLNTQYNFNLKGLKAGVNFNTIATKGTLFFLWKNDTTGAYIPASNTLSDYRTYRTTVDPFVSYTTPGGFSHKLRTRWFNATNKNNTNQNTQSDLFYTEYQFQKHFGETFTITSGLVNIFSVVKSEMYGDHDGSQTAAYLQGDLKTGRFVFSAGTRAEQNKVDDLRDKWIPVFRSGINYHIFSETYLRASAGQGYRFPSIAERFVRTNVSGVNIFPNETLEAEKGLSLEMGIRQGFRIGTFKGMADAAFFRNDYKNMMEFVFAQWDYTPIIFQNLGFRSVNVGNTRIRGFEVSLAGECAFRNGLTVSILAGYTFIDPRQQTYDSSYVRKIGYANYMGSDSSDFLKYRYRHTFKGDLEVSYGRFSLGGSLRYNSVMVNIDRIFMGGILDLAFPPGLGIADYRKYHPHGDLIVDMRLSCAVNKYVRLSFIIKNISNHIYMQRPADMQPPRSFVLQGGIKF